MNVFSFQNSNRKIFDFFDYRSIFYYKNLHFLLNRVLTIQKNEFEKEKAKSIGEDYIYINEKNTSSHATEY